MAKVKVEMTDCLQKVYDVRGGMTIGRDPKNDVQLLELTVSRSHARFIVEGENIAISDLGSTNGTKVNGKKITRQLLADGDLIETGPVRITFEKETPRVAEENLFLLEDSGISEEKIARMADRSQMGLVFATGAQMIEIAYRLGMKFLERTGLPENDNTNLLVGFYEALDNARRHGNKNDGNKRISLYFADSPDKVTVAVLDEGKGYDFASVLQECEERDILVTARERYLSGRMGGLGVRLMLKCADRIEYEMGGSRIVLTKFKKAPAKKEPKQKRLTREEEVYKQTLWEELKLLGPERFGSREEITDRQREEEEAGILPQADDRPVDRLRRFQERISAFFLNDKLRLEDEIETEEEEQDFLEGLR
jgi:pSer/pThr/pTyr-binding forkhead associated (FHA) protein